MIQELLIKDRRILNHDTSNGDLYLLDSLQRMKRLTQKSEINFIHNFAIRIFLKSGYSVSLTTSKDWNSFLCDTKNQKCIKEHYSYYLKLLASNDLKFQIRRPEDINTNFLQHLEQAKMCNSLTVFRRSEDVIVACFFAALPAHKEAVSLFYNKLDLFSEISLSVEQELLRNDNYLKAIDGKYRIKILEPFDIKLIFKDEESIKNYGQTVFYEGKELFFTSQETTILRNIALNYTLKSLSGLLEISVSGVNFHINNIKNKIGLNSKQEVVLFSNDIKDQIKTTRNNEICN